jgi:6-phosphofructokinase 1
MILEVMGRGAGWIAMTSGIAGGADVILIPEIPFDIEVVAENIAGRSSRGSKFSIVVVAEGAFPALGEQLYTEHKIGDKTLKTLGGIGQWLSEELSQKLAMESRVTVLGHLQRGGTPTAYDRFIATRFGMHAVELLAEEKFGYMTCLRGGKIDSVTIEEAVGEIKYVDPEGETVRTAEKLGICMGRRSKWSR